MPYVYYTRMTGADVRAIRTYLKSVAPVRHRVVANQLPFPFNIRASLWLWDTLYFTPGEFEPHAGRSAEWNRGAYLVEGPGHCGACHTPKTALGGDESDHAFAGYSLQGWFGPDITNDARLGLGNWTAADLVRYLKSGHNRFAAASGPMAEEVADSSSQMTDADLSAIAVYLKDRAPPSAGSPPAATPADDPRMRAGAAIYGDLCSACHKPDGSGVPFLIPNLADSGAVASREPTTLMRVVLRGVRSVGTAPEPTAPAMPEYGSQLTDPQVAAVLTYIRGSWGHAAPAVTEAEVRKARRALLPAD
jgi:mono/diheme cytochrome c family protein